LITGEQWIIVTVIVLLVFIVLLYLGAYLYCLILNPDALRSERYSLQKMAIIVGVLEAWEKSAGGDHRQ